MSESVLTARYSPVCNVLRQWKTSLILTYRVYRLYDTSRDYPLRWVNQGKHNRPTTNCPIRNHYSFRHFTHIHHVQIAGIYEGYIPRVVTTCARPCFCVKRHSVVTSILINSKIVVPFRVLGLKIKSVRELMSQTNDVSIDNTWSMEWFLSEFSV